MIRVDELLSWGLGWMIFAHLREQQFQSAIILIANINQIIHLSNNCRLQSRLALFCFQVGLECLIDGKGTTSQYLLDGSYIQCLLYQQLFSQTTLYWWYFFIWSQYVFTIAFVLRVHSSIIFFIYLSINAYTFYPQGLVYWMSGNEMYPSYLSIPSLVTSAQARLYAFSRSSYAPVVTQLKKWSQAHLPPKMKHILSSNSYFVCSWFSFRKYWANPKDPLERGIIVTLSKGSAPYKNQETTAWPLQWQATVFFSLMDTKPFLSTPPITLSEDNQKSIISTISLPHLAARMAASLQRLAIYAPLNPGVRDAILLAYYSLVNLGERCKGVRWTNRIQNLPLRSGRPTQTSLSNLPALTKALSNISFLFVAAITITLLFVPNPSIQTRSWFKVLSLSSLEPILFYLFLPTASSSSMNIIEGADYLAWWKSQRTREAPTPTNTSTKSEPETEKKGTPASPAQALAKRVLPVPGGPVKRTPLGMVAPSA